MSCGKVKQNTLTDTFRKKRRRKTAKKKKRKPTPSREECELARITEARRRKAKLKDCSTSLTERSVKVLPEKIMPAGCHFRRTNGAAAWP